MAVTADEAESNDYEGHNVTVKPTGNFVRWFCDSVRHSQVCDPVSPEGSTSDGFLKMLMFMSTEQCLTGVSRGSNSP